MLKRESAVVEEIREDRRDSVFVVRLCGNRSLLLLLKYTRSLSVLFTYIVSKYSPNPSLLLVLYVVRVEELF